LPLTKKENLLADNPETMENYLPTESIIAIHSEKEEIIEETNRLLENIW
jgi:hypothetical protein